MSSNLRVALFSFHSSPVATLGLGNAGGMNVYIYYLSKFLGSMGINVDIFTRCKDKNSVGIFSLFPKVRLINIFDPNIKNDKASISNGINAFIQEVLNFTLSHEIRYDIIHSHYWLSGLIGKKLSDQWNVPHVTTFHTVGDIKNICFMSQVEKNERILAERMIAFNADSIVAADTHEIQFLSRAYRIPIDNFTLTSGGVDLSMFYPINKLEAREKLSLGNEKILLSVGRLDPVKGFDLLLEAASLIKDYHDIKIIIIGGNSSEDLESQKLYEIATQLGISENIRFQNAVEQNVLAYYYSSADILTIPSYYESFGLIALEAMACGLPVVAMRTGGLANLITHGQTGLLVGKRSSRTFASAILTLLNNESLRFRMGQNGIEYASTFTWTRVAQSVKTTYEKLVGLHLSV